MVVVVAREKRMKKEKMKKKKSFAWVWKAAAAAAEMNMTSQMAAQWSSWARLDLMRLVIGRQPSGRRLIAR